MGFTDRLGWQESHRSRWVRPGTYPALPGNRAAAQVGVGPEVQGGTSLASPAQSSPFNFRRTGSSIPRPSCGWRVGRRRSLRPDAWQVRPCRRSVGITSPATACQPADGIPCAGSSPSPRSSVPPPGRQLRIANRGKRPARLRQAEATEPHASSRASSRKIGCIHAGASLRSFNSSRRSSAGSLPFKCLHRSSVTCSLPS